MSGEHIDEVAGPPQKDLSETEHFVQVEVQGLAAALTDADEEQRQAAIATVRDQCNPLTQSQVIDQLIAVVKAGRKTSQRAIDSLARLTPFSLPGLVTSLQSTRKPGVQLRLLQALTALAPHLDASLRLSLRTTLVDLWFRSSDPEVRRAISTLIAEGCLPNLASQGPAGRAAARIQIALQAVDTLSRRQAQLLKERDRHRSSLPSPPALAVARGSTGPAPS
jgi:hypothetical protein